MTLLQNKKLSMSIMALSLVLSAQGFAGIPPFAKRSYRTSICRLYSGWREGDDRDSNVWISSQEKDSSQWETDLKAKQDGSYWSSFEPSMSDDTTSASFVTEEQEEDAWLDTLAQLSAEEIQFNLKENDRADKARQMEEWGFTRESIANTLDVATDTALEDAQQVEGMKSYRERVFEAERLDDLSIIESHTRVEKDDETGEPIRSQMVYVDEHACIGCTNCAMIAQSTFYMNQEHGRARVYNQWGDDDETIQVAIETCPVNCIHYVPYEELVQLEIDRRTQNINPKARLVSQAENTNTLSHMSSGSVAFTAPQKISGNQKARCTNCPTRGCANCPMYGVGMNPEFLRKEKLRKERLAKHQLQQQRERTQKSVEL
jgi:ferredoxin